MIMITIRHCVCVFLSVLVFQHVQSAPATDDIRELLDELLTRIETLEVSDAANKAKIVEMEAQFKLRQSESEREIFVLKETIKKMESDSKHKEEIMLRSIYKQGMEAGNDKSDDMAESRLGDNDRTGQTTEGGIQKRRSSIRKVREVPEMETAFYATHVVHNNHDLGANQIIPFQQTVTNVGNAYNNNTSVFVAPVDGTYVFHATVMGIDASNVYNHMKAHFDVDGTKYSVFYVTAYDQSSQMLVINLKAGQSVSVKNDYLGTGFIGTHNSSFSGFLLYQHYPNNNIVGK
ncbi:Complement C1q-like protein 4 [Mactra antiquata]